MANRLSIINDALIATGNEPRNSEYDGSPEWTAADSGYRRAIEHLLSKHVWNFASTTTPLASRLTVSPSGLAAYTSAYAQPGDCLRVEAVYLNGVPISDYEIVDQAICTRFESGLAVKYVRTPSDAQWPVGFVELLRIKLEANLLRSLNEDTDNARRRDADVEKELAEYRAMSDQQEGRVVRLNSPSLDRRRGGFGASRGRC